MNKVIKENRIKVGLTQRELADKLGVAQSTIGMYEQGYRYPSHKQVPKLCQILKIEPNDLYK